MRTVSFRALGAALLVIPLAAYPPHDLQNCPDIDHSGSDTYGLEYELTIPSKCPVPLGIRGEKKQAGARIFDTGTRDFQYAEVEMQNSDREHLISRLFRFVSDAAGRYGAVPRTDYPAGTGSHGEFNYDQAFDYGLFAVTNNSVEAGIGDPFGQIQITYKASTMNASVGGPVVPLSNTTQTWSASAAGGNEPYSYNWYRDGTWVGSGANYTGSTGTEDLRLLAEVTDAAMVVRNAVLVVDVDGVLVSISGPSTVYASQGGGTWTASWQGGSAPYSLEWFLDGVHVGSGDTFSGYTGEFSHVLSVRISDAAGSSHDAVRAVTGIGNETCEPEPPALTC